MNFHDQCLTKMRMLFFGVGVSSYDRISLMTV